MLDFWEVGVRVGKEFLGFLAYAVVLVEFDFYFLLLFGDKKGVGGFSLI